MGWLLLWWRRWTGAELSAAWWRQQARSETLLGWQEAPRWWLTSEQPQKNRAEWRRAWVEWHAKRK
jgi:hypothetical protein